MSCIITMTERWAGEKDRVRSCEFRRLSRWITVRNNYSPSKRNGLWDYVRDGRGNSPGSKEFNPKDGLFLDWFRFNGRNYAIEQFLLLGSMCEPAYYVFTDKDGKEHGLSGIDCENLYDPLYIETDEYCEKVRVYRQV